MSVKTEPKFQVGQIAVLKHSKKTLPFVILEAVWNDGWFYKWNKRNAASEHMVRGLTPEEVGKSVCENCDDLTHLFELQNTRMDKATKLWRDATGKHDTLPDLGSLLDWLMETRTMIPPEPREPAAREVSELLDSYDSAVWLAGRKMATEGDGARLKELRSKILAYSAELRAQLKDMTYVAGQTIVEQVRAAKAEGRAEAAEAALKDQTFWADQYHKVAIASEASLVQAREAFKLIGGACDCSPSTMEEAILYIAKIAGGAESRLASTSAPEGTV